MIGHKLVIPPKKERKIIKLHPDDYGYHYRETNTDYLNEHAEEFVPPMGERHMHLIYARTVHWRVVWQGSSVCRVKGRCYKVKIEEVK